MHHVERGEPSSVTIGTRLWAYRFMPLGPSYLSDSFRSPAASRLVTRLIGRILSKGVIRAETGESSLNVPASEGHSTSSACRR